MSIKLNDRGAVKVLRAFFKRTACANTLGLADAGNMLLKLYINTSLVLGDTDTTGTYAGTSPNEVFTHTLINGPADAYMIEGTMQTPNTGDNGYAPKELTVTNWTVEIKDNIARAIYPQQQFVFNGPLIDTKSIKGYYITDSDGEMIYAEAASQPFTPTEAGDAILFTPIFQLSSGIPT